MIFLKKCQDLFASYIYSSGSYRCQHQTNVKHTVYGKCGILRTPIFDIHKLEHIYIPHIYRWWYILNIEPMNKYVVNQIFTTCLTENVVWVVWYIFI